MDEPPLTQFLVEHYLPGATQEELRGASSRLADATGDLALAGESVHYLGSTIVPAEESCFSRFESGSEATVRRALERAEVAYARIHVAEAVHPTSERNPHQEGS
jgi:cob(I)alamin adenosyltransferase